MVSLIVHAAVARPARSENIAISNTTISFEDLSELSPKSLQERAGSFYLRILPLGGSITVGWGSSTGNGLVQPPIPSLRACIMDGGLMMLFTVTESLFVTSSERTGGRSIWLERR